MGQGVRGQGEQGGKGVSGSKGMLYQVLGSPPPLWGQGVRGQGGARGEREQGGARVCCTRF